MLLALHSVWTVHHENLVQDTAHVDRSHEMTSNLDSRLRDGHVVVLHGEREGVDEPVAEYSEIRVALCECLFQISEKVRLTVV